jgi:hypothetical protein
MVKRLCLQADSPFDCRWQANKSTLSPKCDAALFETPDKCRNDAPNNLRLALFHSGDAQVNI